jgi:hypothetical protein
MLKMVRFQVLMLTSMKTAVFWDVAPCSQVDIGPGLEGSTTRGTNR